MPIDLFIYGAGGHGKVVLDAVQRQGLVAVPVDDAPERDGDDRLGATCRLFSDQLTQEIGKGHVAIGTNSIRRLIADKLKALGVELTSVWHPSAILSSHAKFGDGVFAAAGATVGPDAVVGAGVILNHGAIIDHDCRVGAWTHIAPNATLGGEVKIGDSVLVGSGAVILPGVEVGAGAVIGSGAVVTRNVKAGAQVVGVPAREISK